MLNRINKSSHAGFSLHGQNIILPGYLVVCATILFIFAFMFTSEIDLWFGVQSLPDLGINVVLALWEVSGTFFSVFSSLEQAKRHWGCVFCEGAVSVQKH